MRLAVLNMNYQIVGQVGIKIKTSITGVKPVVENMYQSRWKGQFCKQNKLAKSANLVSEFKAKHAISEQRPCLEESQNCFKSKVDEGFGFIDLNCLIEQLRRGCCTCKISFLTPTAFSPKIRLLKLGVKINVKSIIYCRL